MWDDEDRLVGCPDWGLTVLQRDVRACRPRSEHSDDDKASRSKIHLGLTSSHVHAARVAAARQSLRANALHVERDRDLARLFEVERLELAMPSKMRPSGRASTRRAIVHHCWPLERKIAKGRLAVAEMMSWVARSRLWMMGARNV
jgi:hypothetical protein